MTDKIKHGPEKIDPTTFSKATIAATFSIHLTGGIRAARVGPDWSVRPVRSGAEMGVLRPVPRATLDRIAYDAGLRVIGGDETTDFNTPLPSRIWTPLYGQHIGRRSQADEWGAISNAARRTGDNRVADLARSIAISLNAAGIRIRDASDCYHAQLMAALQKNKKVDSPFSNIPRADLFLAFHSLLAEMASTRDYISAFAGHRVGAPPNKDSLKFLADWASIPSHAEQAADPLVSAMMEAWKPGAWLRDLTNYRNMFLHRKPMEMISGALLVLKEKSMGQFVVPRIELPIPIKENSTEIDDALNIFVGLHEKLLRFAAFAADHATYSTAPPEFIVAR